MKAASASTFSVTNTNTSGSGSFVQALIDANANPGHDTINFNISGTGPHVFTNIWSQIQITDPITIDGLSQSGSQCRETLNIVFDYDGTWNPSLTFVSGSEGSIIQGLVTNRGTSNFGYYVNADDVTFRCNYFEMSADGSAVENELTTSALLPGSGNNTIVGGPSFEDGNVFGSLIDTSASSGDGILIQNNTFGFNADETQFLRTTRVLSNYFYADITNVSIKNNIFQGGYLSGIDGLSLTSNTVCLNKDRTASVCSAVDTSERLVLNSSTNVDIGTATPGTGNYFGNGYDCGVCGEGLENINITNNYFGTNDGESIIEGGISGYAVGLSGNDIDISNNSVLSDTGSGFSIGQGTNVGIQNNFLGVSRSNPEAIIGLGGSGLNIGGSYGQTTLENINVQDNFFGGVVAAGLNINSSGTLTGLNVSNNSFVDGEAYAMALYGNTTLTGGGIIANNSFVGNAGGIWGNGAIQELDIHDNLFDGSTDSNLGLIVANSNVHNNIFKNHPYVAIGADPNTNIYDNEFVDNPAIAVQAEFGASVYNNTFTNTGTRAIHLWNAQQWVAPPVLTNVTQDGPNQITYYVQFETPIAGDYRFDICNNPTGNVPTESGDCEEIVYTVTVPHANPGGASYGIGASGTALPVENLTIMATLVDPNSSDGYGFTTEIGRSDPPRAELDIDVNIDGVHLAPPGPATNFLFARVCSSGDLDIESFTLNNEYVNFSNATLTLNTQLSTANDDGSYNSSTGVWQGELGPGQCLYFSLSGTVVNSLGEEMEWQGSVVSITPDGGDEITDINTSSSSDFTHLEINQAPDLAVDARLLTEGPITSGSQVTYELAIKNIGLGDLPSGDIGIYFILPSNASFVSVTDGNIYDALSVYECSIVAPDIHDLGDQFENYHGVLIGCSFESSEDIVPPGSNYLMHVNLTAGENYSSGNTQVLGVAVGEDPESSLFMGTFMSGGDGFALCEDGHVPVDGEECNSLNNIFRLVYDNSELTVTINRCEGQEEITQVNDACFTVTFNKPVWVETFTEEDLVLEGGGQVYSFVQNSPTQWTVRITGMTLGGTLRLLLGANSVSDGSAVENGTYVLGENIIRYGLATDGTDSGSSSGSASGGAVNSASGSLAKTGSNLFLTQAMLLMAIGFFLQKSSRRRYMNFSFK